MMNKVVEFYHALLGFYLSGSGCGDCTSDLLANEALNSTEIIFNMEPNHYGS